MGDSVAAEEALTSNEKAIREYWEAEVGIIKVQLRYRMQRQGRVREAHTIYNQLLRNGNEPSYIGLTTVASKNLIAAIRIRIFLTARSGSRRPQSRVLRQS